MKNFILFLGLFLTLQAGSAIIAQAQDSQIFIPPASQFSNNAETVRQIERNKVRSKAGKIKAGIVQIKLVHYNYMEPEQFGILMTLPDATTGCFDLSPLEYEAKFVADIYMDIKVKGYVRKTAKTKDVAFDCDKKTKLVSGLIVLSAEDLKKKNVSEIRFSNGNTRDIYNVTYIDNGIELSPDTMQAFKAQGLTGGNKDKLVHYFGNQTLIALHVPMAKDGEDVAQAVRNLAYRSALQPVFQQEGLDTSGDENIYYFLDPQGRILSMLNESGYMELGSVNVPRPYDGPQGRQAIGVPLKVFATRPGTTL